MFPFTEGVNEHGDINGDKTGDIRPESRLSLDICAW